MYAHCEARGQLISGWNEVKQANLGGLVPMKLAIIYEYWHLGI